MWRLSLAIFFLPEVLMARSAITAVRIAPIALEIQMLLGEEEMTSEAMVKESEAILDREKDTAFIRIQFASSNAMLRTALPDGVSNRGIWAAAKRRWNRSSVHYGELISMRGNAVLRIRDGFEVRTIIVRGENPLVVSYEGRKVEFVHFGMFYNNSKTRVLWVDASAVVQSGGLDAKLAQSVVVSVQRAVKFSLGANLAIGEDRFGFFAARFVHSLLFDLADPPEDAEWSKIQRAECGLNRNGRGFCSVDRPAPGSRQHIEF